MCLNVNKFKPEDPLIHREVIQRKVTDWYRSEGRILPWRAPPGHNADPYHEWLSEIMLQQTGVKTVIPFFQKFIQRWPCIERMAAAPVEEIMREWAGLGYYSRARNLHKCAKIVVQDFQGKFPDEAEELKRLPGIGPYTAAAISSIAFGRPNVVIDGNVERVISRLFALSKPPKEAKKELNHYAAQLSDKIDEHSHPGDFAQAIMDIGATICTPSKPACFKCPLIDYCQAYNLSMQDKLPAKANKRPKPKRYGVLYFCENNQNHLLFEHRPEEGLLAGMVGVPGSEWLEDSSLFERRSGQSQTHYLQKFNVKHVFTHFELHLQAEAVKFEEIDASKKLLFWHPIDEYDKLGLPKLYKKVLQQYLKLRGL